ncbi:MAG TPA: FecR domain-containing protein [Puia sp.]|nr:FecR domain-containing protein [Puia sp.]
MNEEILQELLQRYRLGQCTGEERILVESWYIAHAQALGPATPDSLPAEGQKEAGWVKIRELTGLGYLHRRRPLPRILYWSAAAALLFVLTGGAWLYSRYSRAGTAASLSAKTDVAPGGNKAILTLSNGQTITLTGAQNGQLAAQGKTRITKTADGQLRYDPSGKGGSTMMNTVSTPRGGQYQLVLSDGSRVWLNAASSIHYPVAFSDKERKVVITGEAWFEVTPDKSRPFVVTAGEQTIKVLGTQFDIDSYADEPLNKTTLVEGSVQVSKGTNSVILKPGQQSKTEAGDEKLAVVPGIDIDAELAWKSGDFVFTNEELPSIMRKIARWYDVDIAYEGNPGSLKFGGVVSRSKNLSAVLQIMETTQKVHFKMEKRRLIVITNP